MIRMSWTLAPALTQLMAEVNAAWPNRDRSTDGTIGDYKHSLTTSEHNPYDEYGKKDPDGVVRAVDIDKDGIHVPTLLNATIGDRRVHYVIYNKIIYSCHYGWRARPYHGEDPHTGHIHISLRNNTSERCEPAVVLAAHREYLDGYLPDRSSSQRRWRIRGHMDLLARLSRRGVLGWALASTGLAALYGSVSGSVNDLLAPDSPTASYVGKMASGSAVEQFMSLLTVVTVLLVAVAAVRRMNRLAGLEHAGLVEVELATGVSRSRLFLSQVLSALLESIVLLLVSATVLAATTATQLTDDHAVARSFVFTVSQLPGMVAAVGIAAALVGMAPKLTGMSWAVVAWSAFAQFFGGLVELKDWAKDLSVLGHHLDVVGSPDWKPLAVQTAVGLVGVAIGMVAYTRRDLPS